MTSASLSRAVKWSAISSGLKPAMRRRCSGGSLSSASRVRPFFFSISSYAARCSLVCGFPSFSSRMRAAIAAACCAPGGKPALLVARSSTIFCCVSTALSTVVSMPSVAGSTPSAFAWMMSSRALRMRCSAASSGERSLVAAFILSALKSELCCLIFSISAFLAASSRPAYRALAFWIERLRALDGRRRRTRALGHDRAHLGLGLARVGRGRIGAAVGQRLGSGRARRRGGDGGLGRRPEHVCRWRGRGWADGQVEPWPSCYANGLQNLFADEAHCRGRLDVRQVPDFLQGFPISQPSMRPTVPVA